MSEYILAYLTTGDDDDDGGGEELHSQLFNFKPIVFRQVDFGKKRHVHLPC